MQRRYFVKILCSAPLVGYAAAQAETEAEAGGIQTFAYYQPLLPGREHDPRQTDGTTYDMPCITEEDIAAGVDKEYDFWHGHGSLHKFVVTAEAFLALQEGEDVVIKTDFVGGHCHPLLISPNRSCESAC